MTEKELACLVAEIRLDWPAGRSNIGRVDGLIDTGLNILSRKVIVVSD